MRLARGTRKKTLLRETKIQIEKFYFGEIGKHRNCMNGLTGKRKSSLLNSHE